MLIAIAEIYSFFNPFKPVYKCQSFKEIIIFGLEYLLKNQHFNCLSFRSFTLSKIAISEIRYYLKI